MYQATIAPQPTATSVPIVVDNNTSRAVTQVDISGTAKDPTGKIVGIGSSHGTSPPVIQPGEWALAAISFPSAARLSTSDTMSFNVKA
ncbi:MAG: hypothetical protein J2P57_22530, partial [Acidimicrobiaceae bacterium]|nr:hypothetical protein [Acidimicrobiaceae bacterium]